MTLPQFTYWLKGWAELSTETLTENQLDIIQDHIDLVRKTIKPEVKIPKTEHLPKDYYDS